MEATATTATTATTAMAVAAGVEVEAVRERVRVRLQRGGVLASLRAQLRACVLRELRHASGLATPPPAKSTARVRALNAIVADFLERGDHSYALSVFAAEADAASDASFSAGDVGALLGLPPLYDDRGLLEQLVAAAARTTSVRSIAVQSDDTRPEDRLERQLRRLDDNDDDDDDDGREDAEARMTRFRRECEARADERVRLELERLRSGELARLRLELSEAAQLEVREAREAAHRERVEGAARLRERETRAEAALRARTRDAEADEFRRRQQLLAEADAVRVRELDLRARASELERRADEHRRSFDVAHADETRALEAARRELVLAQTQVECERETHRQGRAALEISNRRLRELEDDRARIDEFKSELVQLREQKRTLEAQLAAYQGVIEEMKLSAASRSDRIRELEQDHNRGGDGGGDGGDVDWKQRLERMAAEVELLAAEAENSKQLLEEEELNGKALRREIVELQDQLQCRNDERQRTRRRPSPTKPRSPPTPPSSTPPPPPQAKHAWCASVLEDAAALRTKELLAEAKRSIELLRNDASVELAASSRNELALFRERQRLDDAVRTQLAHAGRGIDIGKFVDRNNSTRMLSVSSIDERRCCSCRMNMRQCICQRQHANRPEEAASKANTIIASAAVPDDKREAPANTVPEEVVEIHLDPKPVEQESDSTPNIETGLKDEAAEIPLVVRPEEQHGETPSLADAVPSKEILKPKDTPPPKETLTMKSEQQSLSETARIEATASAAQQEPTEPESDRAQRELAERARKKREAEMEERRERLREERADRAAMERRQTRERQRRERLAHKDETDATGAGRGHSESPPLPQRRVSHVQQESTPTSQPPHQQQQRQQQQQQQQQQHEKVAPDPPLQQDQSEDSFDDDDIVFSAAEDEDEAI